MSKTKQYTTSDSRERTIRDLVNSPFKKLMFGIQILSYILIPGSPVIGGFIGRALDLKTAQTAGLILGIFIVGEILFYGSLFFLGKELLMILRDKFRRRFRKKDRSTDE